MKTFTKFCFLALMMAFSSSLIAQQSAISQTGTTQIDKMELIQQQHGPTISVAKAMEGTRATGDDCSDPILITVNDPNADLPYSALNQTTTGRGNTYDNTCLNDFDGGEDIVYELVLGAEATLNFEIDPKGTLYSGFALSESCGWNGTCMAISTDTYGTGAAHGFTIALDAGTYYIIVDTWPNPTSIPDFDLTITQTTAVPNDDCANATPIDEVMNYPFNTEQATNGGGLTGGANIWFAYTATVSGNVVFDLCASDYDTQLGLWNSCGGSVLASNDDACGYEGLQSKTQYAVTAGTTYYIEIGGFAGASGDGILSIYEETTCDLTCPGSGIAENEPCGDDINGGCNMDTPAFTSVSSGDLVCGNLWNEGGARDTDWFELVVTDYVDVTLTVQAEEAVVIGLVGQVEPGVPGCDNLTGFLTEYEVVPACIEGFIEVLTLEPGTYYFFIASQEYFGSACPGFDYHAEFTTEAVATGFISGEVIGSDVATGLEDIPVTAGDWTTYTNSSGNYVIEVPVGTYDVTADGYDFAYTTETNSDVVVTENNVSTSSFVLDPLEAPELLSAVADIEQVTLTWDPISLLKDGVDGTETLMGQIESDNEYVPGSTMNLEFTMTIFSPDFEWAEYAEMVFPPEFVPVSASDLNGVAASINGQEVTWNGFFYTSDYPAEIEFSVEVAIDGGANGPIMIDYYVEGDGFGGSPHYFESFVTVYESGGSYVPTFNVYRKLGPAGNSLTFIPIAYGVVGNTYVDEIYPGGDEWCYRVTQIMPDGTESPMSNILCATPLVLPGSTCETALDYGEVNDPLVSGSLIREDDVRWYEFDVPYTMDIAISLCGSDFDTYLELYDACEGTLLAANDDSDYCGDGSVQSELIFELLPGGTYYVAISGVDGEFGNFDLLITQIQVLTIRENWSGFSIYMNPIGDLNIANQLEEVEDNMIITIRQTPYGIWWPPQNINTIGDISPEIGYKAKMDEQDETIIYGSEVADKTVNLPAGVSYLPVKVTAPTPTSDITDALGDDLLILFDIHTNEIVWPDGGIFTLNFLVPDRAYLINMINPSSYTYPIPSSSPAPQIANPDMQNRAGSWNEVVNTGITHFISIHLDAQSNFDNGDVIGVFDSEGTCVGMAVVDHNGNLLLAANGDDELTDAKDGLVEGEKMSYKLYKSATGEEMALEATYSDQMNATGLFEVNGTSMITDLKAGSTSVDNNALSSLSIYPNPSTGLLKISGLNAEADMIVSNAHGQIVYRGRVNGNTDLDLSTQPKGVYFIKLMSEDATKIEKVVLK
ncbi:MAG: T9SS type A sorting domain-containing protein [Bacteroidales bacterium]